MIPTFSKYGLTLPVLVGSTYACTPVPEGADRDWLALTFATEAPAVEVRMLADGWCLEGSRPTDDRLACGGDNSFSSFRRGEDNIILTTCPGFYRKFLAATSVAKRLNVQCKADRIALFQAVLYGNGGAE